METTTPPIPDGFRQMIEQNIGIPEAELLLNKLDTDPVVAIRLNRHKGMAMEGTAVPWCERGRILSERPAFTLDPAWHQGRYYVQEPASMFAAFAARHIVQQEEHRPLLLLDLCAAPGGKTTAIADELPYNSMIVANEFMPQRAEILAENLLKWGIENMLVTQGDTEILSNTLAGTADVVIADVPCSGEGMMRKEAEARRQWSPTLIADCAALQRRIAANGANTLRKGGWMIYSTCTFNSDENERNVAWICSELGFKVEELPIDPAWNLINTGVGYHFFPHLTNTEGLYMCLLRKTSDSNKTRIKPQKTRHIVHSDIPWINADNKLIFESDNTAYITLPEYADLVCSLMKCAKTLLPGVPVASKGKHGWEPTHAATISMLLHRGVFPELPLTRNQALRYLARRTDILPLSSEKGFVIPTYEGLPLGRLKNTGNRYNNPYPKNWRIRTSVE